MQHNSPFILCNTAYDFHRILPSVARDEIGHRTGGRNLKQHFKTNNSVLLHVQYWEERSLQVAAVSLPQASHKANDSKGGHFLFLLITMSVSPII